MFLGSSMKVTHLLESVFVPWSWNVAWKWEKGHEILWTMQDGKHLMMEQTLNLHIYLIYSDMKLKHQTIRMKKEQKEEMFRTQT